ncbi:cAMP phosphodiesterases class-II domain-containing protein [Ceratobasidium sp. AG-Ba]|nr:cAMP phosphodiesterases class-II domain-containing protein [Ceratobasidium sp. AG-Ba]QRW04253.1 cAMP phosphodiesterases class-II domain-containing protein [Ceratobasidium sp. AG-Ba]
MSTRKVKRRRISAPSGQFDLVVVGSGGGNDETNLSGYLCKPRDQPWDAGILGLEAGSGYGALKRLLSTSHPHLFSSLDPKSKSSSKLSPTDRAYAVYAHLKAYLLTHAHLDHAASLVISAGSLPGPTKHILGAQGVLDDLYRCIFSPGRCWPSIVSWEGGHGGKLRALPVNDEYSDLGVGIDSIRARVVPVSHGGSCANDQDGIYRSSAFFVRHVPTQHEFLFFGDVEADPDLDVSAPSSPPHSTPTLTPASTLDSLPVDPPPNGLPTEGPNDLPATGPNSCPNGSHPTRPLLFPIWQDTARLFVSSNLHTILLECSWPAGRPAAQMFGHLGVEQVRKEMRVLAQQVVKLRQSQPVAVSIARSRRAKSASPPPPPTHTTRSLKRKATHLSLQPTVPSSPLTGALKGLRVLVIHCKEPSPGFDLAGAPTIADYIVRQLNDGVPGTDLGPNDLGVEYIAAHQGDEFVL